ncbi:FtsQ-type POTRA domain-containing protein [Candidatus Parcubacteria bacterium]|nr:MAG: FtsQ-type POTRA domain-containing protein [Candidatus Parcubacteria bacterium]
MRQKQVEQKTYFEETKEKRKKRRRFSWAVLGILSLGILTYGAGWILFRSPIFQMERIEIEGTKRVKQEDVLAAFMAARTGEPFYRKWFNLRNILAWPDALDENDLRTVPAVKSAEVEKDFDAHTIRVVVKEREPYGIWCQKKDPTNNPCFWFDTEGVVFERALGVEGNLIKVLNDYAEEPLGLGRKILPDRFVSNLLSIFEVLGRSGLSVREVRLDNLLNEEIEVRTNGGPKLYFSLRFSAASTLAAIETVTARSDFKRLEYVDFRVENRAYYK